MIHIWCGLTEVAWKIKKQILFNEWKDTHLCLEVYHRIKEKASMMCRKFSFLVSILLYFIRAYFGILDIWQYWNLYVVFWEDDEGKTPTPSLTNTLNGSWRKGHRLTNPWKHQEKSTGVWSRLGILITIIGMIEQMNHLITCRWCEMGFWGRESCSWVGGGKG